MFTVWAPFVRELSLRLFGPPERYIPMQKEENGYWSVLVNGIKPGTLYLYNLGRELKRPDPASFYQPYGVHKASEVVDHGTFHWEDNEWSGIPLSEMIMYEIHIGTFSPEGTFDAVVDRLDELLETGINTLEIMPVSQFPGERNWGYDGACPFAVQNSYGGPDGLRRLVNACHKKGMAVILDVVYNHLGPEGNYLRDFAPYFTDRYKTPWGEAVNYDGAYSNDVRRYFIENALYWFRFYHIDALRLDAIHGIYDMSARPFLLELAERANEFSRKQGRKFYLIAESDLNNSKVVDPPEKGGFGLDCMWCDDFHHSVHTLLTGESNGYYMDFGETEHLVKSLKEGFVLSGRYSSFRKRNHGNSSAHLSADKFVVFAQNHDQVGNRMKGDRLSSLVSFESLKLSACIVILSQNIPLLFMGEEYADPSPFLYFVSHSDPDLISAVRKGRREEFAGFAWDEEPPDPQSMDTFMKSKLNRNLRKKGDHEILRYFYMELIRLRKTISGLLRRDRDSINVSSDKRNRVIFMKRWNRDEHILAIFNFNKSDVQINITTQSGKMKKILDSADEKWKGQGSLLPEDMEDDEGVTLRAESCALYLSI